MLLHLIEQQILIILYKVIELVTTTNVYNLLIICDINKSLIVDTKKIPNYFTDKIEEKLDVINNYIEKLINDKSDKKGLIIIYGLNKFISKITDKKKLDKLSENLKRYEKMNIIFVDDAPKIKSVTFESWFSSITNLSDGVWIGRGLSDQNLLRLSNINREMTKDIKNDMGYLITDGIAELVRFIDFITKEGE